jgi:predicted NBD/HSP70 family sugar kinase
MSDVPDRIVAGVLAADRVVGGLVAEGNLVTGVQRFPSPTDSDSALLSMPAGDVAGVIAEQIRTLCAERGTAVDSLTAIGVGFPGIIKDGIIEESPNHQQMKGYHLQDSLRAALGDVPVTISNNADALAAGIAATYGHLTKLIRVWNLGRGIGYGRYPASPGVWEGGHMVVTLDPKENYCGCGGVGHLEGIMGTRAMRKRFLDLEPDEVFANAKAGDERCEQFLFMWHRALAAATASSIHFSGPGRFFVTGPNSRYVDLDLLSRYVYEMVKMSPLQGSVFEIAPVNDSTSIIGAAVNALLDPETVGDSPC